ncbi:MAG TPA: TraR/DksA family transcriptional regulator [Acidimicrobiia bacterium]|nr:TraR/DksA family transcriptional regulator [Acidimicrobiia bacterium]
MADTLHSELREELQAERARLVEQIERLGSTAGSSLDFDENFADSGQVTAERAEVDALAGQLRETLAEIDDALAKFDGGTFGTCESCNQPIGDARLQAMPAARLCMSCASQRR